MGIVACRAAIHWRGCSGGGKAVEFWSWSCRSVLRGSVPDGELAAWFGRNVQAVGSVVAQVGNPLAA